MKNAGQIEFVLPPGDSLSICPITIEYEVRHIDRHQMFDAVSKRLLSERTRKIAHRCEHGQHNSYKKKCTDDNDIGPNMNCLIHAW